MPARDPWRVRLSAAAEADFQDILRWTIERFGEAQARAYAKTLADAVAALSAGPTIPGARRRDKIAKGLFSLHVGRQGRKGRHFVLFRIGRDGDRLAIEVLRLLHDAMDLARHVPTADVPRKSLPPAALRQRPRQPFE